MPSIPCPQFDNLDRYSDSLNKANSAYGKEGNAVQVPDNDASDLHGVNPGNTSKPASDRRGSAVGTQPGPETPLQPVSLASQVADAPPLGAFLESNLHDKNWLDPTQPGYASGRVPKPAPLKTRPYRPQGR